MTIKQFFLGRAIVLSVILVLGFIVGGFYAINNYIYNEKQGNEDVVEENIKLSYRCGDGSEFYVRFDKSMNSAEIIGATDSENFVDTILTKVVTDSGVLYKGGNISFRGSGESVTLSVSSTTTSCKEIRREEDAPFNFGD